MAFRKPFDGAYTMNKSFWWSPRFFVIARLVFGLLNVKETVGASIGRLQDECGAEGEDLSRGPLVLQVADFFHRKHMSVYPFGLTAVGALRYGGGVVKARRSPRCCGSSPLSLRTTARVCAAAAASSAWPWTTRAMCSRSSSSPYNDRP